MVNCITQHYRHIYIYIYHIKPNYVTGNGNGITTSTYFLGQLSSHPHFHPRNRLETKHLMTWPKKPKPGKDSLEVERYRPSNFHPSPKIETFSRGYRTSRNPRHIKYPGSPSFPFHLKEWNFVSLRLRWGSFTPTNQPTNQPTIQPSNQPLRVLLRSRLDKSK